MEELDKALDEVILCIKDSLEYKKCISLKEKMSNNTRIVDLVNKVKRLQKKYIRSNFDENIKKELDSLEEELNDIPIYHIYMDNLEIVNQKIEYVKDSLNDYFMNLLNKK